MDLEGQVRWPHQSYHPRQGPLPPAHPRRPRITPFFLVLSLTSTTKATTAKQQRTTRFSFFGQRVYDSLLWLLNKKTKHFQDTTTLTIIFFSNETRHKLDDNDTLPPSPPLLSFSALNILSFSLFARLMFFFSSSFVEKPPPS